MNSKKRNVQPAFQTLEMLEARQFLSASSDVIVTPSLIVEPAASASGSVQGYTPAQIKTAYGISSIRFGGTTGNGTGQTIAIIDAYSDPNIASDLAVFDKEFGLASASLTQVSATGSTSKLPAENADWDSEISLDVEWAHAIAPDAKIVLVDASSDSMSSLMAAEEYARTIPTVSVISMSWGGSEFSSESSYDKYFTTPSGHIGITFVAASGDSGASGGAEYPAASPNVVAVGGTTLSLSSTGTIESESAWSDSEGGVSQYESTPSYQSSISSSGRSTPDVSYDADPNTGFAVYDSVADDGSVGWQEVGGTSAGTPQWSALIAIADQGRVKNGLGTLTSAQTLNELYGIYDNSTSYAADFNDITTGSSVLSQGGGFGGFGGVGFGGPFGGHGRRSVEEVSATTGYDTLTGIGTPKAAALVSALSTANVSAAVSKTTVTAAKATKTKVAAAIEVDQNKTVLTPGVVNSFSLPTLRHPEMAVEIETTAASSTAAAIGTTTRQSSVPGGSISSAYTIDLIDQSAVVGGASLQTLLTDASTSASMLFSNAMKSALEQVDAQVAELNSSVSAVGGVFREVAASNDFEAALIQFTDECASIPGAAPHRQNASTGTAIAAAAIAADAVLIGYLRSKQKYTVAQHAIFNDDALI